MGWKNGLEKKLLKPVDANGKAIKCSPTGDCEGGFDFTYTQHAAWPRASKKGSIVVFDNGQVRHYEQPALPEMNYSRLVEYKIDPKKMTVASLLTKAMEAVSLGWLNRWLGSGLGALKSLLLVSLLVGVIEFMDADNTLLSQTKKKESVLYYPMKSFAGIFFPAAKHVTEQYILNE